MPSKSPNNARMAIKALRKKLGFSQEQLAHELGVSVFTVSKWENGHFCPSRLAQKELDRLNTRFS